METATEIQPEVQAETNPTFTTVAMPTGITEVGDDSYMKDAKGKLVPVELVKAEDKLTDEIVRRVIGQAKALNEHLSTFKATCFEELGDFDAMLLQEYKVEKGGAKGNRSYVSHDGLFRVQIAVSDKYDFGPQLQTAKTLVDECLTEWSADTRPEIRAIIQRAFNVDKEGQINRAELFSLLRLDIDDDRWKQAMRALKDAIRVIGSKTYIRFYERTGVDGGWEAITIDMAQA